MVAMTKMRKKSDINEFDMLNTICLALWCCLYIQCIRQYIHYVNVVSPSTQNSGTISGKQPAFFVKSTFFVWIFSYDHNYRIFIYFEQLGRVFKLIISLNLTHITRVHHVGWPLTPSSERFMKSNQRLCKCSVLFPDKSKN